jgi:predicted GNAT family N-acyltransferase
MLGSPLRLAAIRGQLLLQRGQLLLCILQVPARRVEACHGHDAAARQILRTAEFAVVIFDVALRLLDLLLHIPAGRADYPARLLGYYTLCAIGISQGEVPEAARKAILRYPLVSASLIGRLAVSKDRQGQRLGAVLLADALPRAFESANTVGSSMVVVDALDESAAGFYAAHGFVRLPDSLRLVLPMRLAGGTAER